VKRRLALATLSALALMAVAAPAPAAAHPLGNFTINQYSRLEPGPETLKITYVVDMAEIPTFQERQAMDADADGAISEAEENAYLDALVPELISGLRLEVDLVPRDLEVLDRQLDFSPGAGDLPTMRLELSLGVALDVDTTEARVTYRVTNFEERIGWRDIIAVAGSGARIDGTSVAAEEPTDELRSYPPEMIENPPDVRSAEFSFSLTDDAGPSTQPGEGEGAIITAAEPGDPLLGLFTGAQTPITALLAILLSMGLGAVHAASPGHGKTLVAAYLVGSHGELRQAVWLALTVAVTHTTGVFVLGVVTLMASELFVPERVITWLAVASGVLVIGLGGSLVLNQLRRSPGAHSHGHDHDHGDHGHSHDGSPSHEAPISRPLTRRSAIALGLAGGLVPSASALIVFLLALTLGRLGFGVVLIVSFGVGMALVLGGVGFVVVIARRAQLRSTHRWSQAPLVRRLGAALPLLSGIAVLATGVVVTLQAATRLT